MMMNTNTTIENYKIFFENQVKEAESEHKNIQMAPVNQLIKKGEIIIGEVDHVNEKQGHVVFRFSKGKAPRLKVLKSITVIKKKALFELGVDMSKWSCSFSDFYKNHEYNSTSNISDIFPLYYQKKENSDYEYVGCTGINIALFELFQRNIKKGKLLKVMLCSPFPPVDYYNNLVNFLERYKNMPEQLIEPKIDFADWKPEELSYDPDNKTAISDTIMDTLNQTGSCILQGPPGTGKSYTIAHIIAEYLNQNKTVCVTTMANKGLIELAQQPPLEPFLKERKISKTNLTADEEKIANGLKPVKNSFVLANGELLCSTNYALSHVYRTENIAKDGLPLYDLVIIEEASQAFLATILAFKKLGVKCLIVGDPMQLPPIIAKPNNPNYKLWKANTQIEGLKTFTLGTEVKSYRIITTFRLTEASAKLTGVFYDNNLISVQKEKVDFSLCNSLYFPESGGVIYHYTASVPNGIASETGLNIIHNILFSIKQNYPERSIAIISPFKDTVKQLQRSFLTDNVSDNLTIETIDRIQGMTVDYAILYIPGRNPAFALDERRFNVATSRSRSTTMIISDIPLTQMHSITPSISTFISKCIHI